MVGNRNNFATLALAAMAMYLVAAGKAPVDPSSYTGSYSVRVGGYYVGNGHAAVGAKSVNIVAEVTDGSGASGKLHASSLDLVDNRFQGQGTCMGVTVTLSGRIDPGDRGGQPIKTARLFCTFQGSDAQYARVVGPRQGGH